MDKGTIQDFLERAYAKGVIDFHLRVMKSPEGFLDFYIHPQNQDGDTGDYTVKGSSVARIGGNLGAGSSRGSS